MGNPGLEFSTAVNMEKVERALDYSRKNLSTEGYNKVQKAYKKMMLHISFCVLTAVIVIFGFLGICVLILKANDSPEAVAVAFIAAIAVPTIMIVGFAVYYRKHTRNGRIWFIYNQWVDTGSERFIIEMKKLLDERSV